MRGVSRPATRRRRLRGPARAFPARWGGSPYQPGSARGWPRPYGKSCPWSHGAGSQSSWSPPSPCVPWVLVPPIKGVQRASSCSQGSGDGWGGFLASKLSKMHFPSTQPPSRDSPHCSDPDHSPSLPFPAHLTCLAFSTTCFSPHPTYLQVVTWAIFCHVLSFPWFPTLLESNVKPQSSSTPSSPLWIPIFFISTL